MPYVAPAVQIQYGDFESDVSPPTSLSDSSAGLVSFWIYAPLTNDGGGEILSSSNFQINYNEGGYIETSMSDATSSSQFDCQNRVAFDLDTWHNILISWDMNTDAGSRNFTLMIDGQIQWPTIFVDTGPAFEIPYQSAGGQWDVIGPNDTQYFSDFYIAPGQYLDLTEPANVAKFIDGARKPVDLGAAGETPTGISPTIFYHGDATTFGNPNLGTGGTFSYFGTAAVDAPSSPSTSPPPAPTPFGRQFDVYKEALVSISGNANTYMPARMVTRDGKIAYVSAQTDGRASGVGGPWIIDTLTIIAGGTGYTYFDFGTLSLPGGTPWPNYGSSFGPFTAVPSSSPGPLAFMSSDPGNPAWALQYLPPPANPVPLAGSGITTGSGATLNLTTVQTWSNSFGPFDVAGIAISGAGSGYRVGETYSFTYHPFGPDFVYDYPTLIPSFKVTAIGGGGALTGISGATAPGFGRFYYSAPPPSTPIAVAGGTGTGATIQIAGHYTGTCLPILAKWDIQNNVKLLETSAAPYGGAADVIYGPIAVRASDGHVFTLNGYEKFYHLSANLGLIGSYTAPFLKTYFSPPGPWWNNTWAQNWAGGNATSRSAWQMDVGTTRAFISGNSDFRARFYGIDVFDISSTNPAFLRTLDWPWQDGHDSHYGPATDVERPKTLIVHESTDTVYVLVWPDLPGGTQEMVLAKAGPSDVVLADVTPWTPGPDRTKPISFVIDPDNDVLIVCFSDSSEHNFIVEGWELPSLSLLWSHSFTPSVERIQSTNAAQNIVGGLWIVVVKNDDTGDSAIQYYDTLTGTMTLEYTQKKNIPDLPSIYYDGSNYQNTSYAALPVTPNSTNTILWIPNDSNYITPNGLHGTHISEVFWSPPSPPGPPPIPFTCWPEVEPVHFPLLNTIPSYLYVQYNDDDSLQAFVHAFNAMTQNIVDSFLTIDLPIYIRLGGALLDWVAAGLYGFPTRPTLVSGHLPVLGTYGTTAYNTEVYDFFGYAGALVYTPVSDDVFHRIITWHFYKGDGHQFDIRWLKRRIARFLFAADDCLFPNIDQTYQISITFGAGNIVYINLLQGVYQFNGEALYGHFAYDTTPYVGEAVLIGTLTPIALAQVFKDCVDGGFLELPFQFQFRVRNII